MYLHILACFQTVPSYSKNFLKDGVKSLYTIRKTLSCKRLFLLLIKGLWNIQTRGQLLNCEKSIYKNAPFAYVHECIFLDNELFFDWLSYLYHLNVHTEIKSTIYFDS